MVFKLEANKIPVVGWVFGWLSGNGMDYGVIVTFLATLFFYLGLSSSTILLGSTLSFFFGLAPIWLLLVITPIFWDKWLFSVGFKFALQNGRTTFRIKLPQEVIKSPQAMEFVLNQIWNPQNPDNYWHTYIDGKGPIPTSLEIVSIGGDVRFYINIVTSKGKEALLPAMYSQYPGVELIEEPVDYTSEITPGDPEWEYMPFHLNRKGNVYTPFKTYIDYQLDQTQKKEEEKIDPLTPLLETMGSIGPNERIYYQIIIKTFRKSSLKNGALQLGEGDDWSKEALKRVDELMMRDPKTKAPKVKEGTDFDGSPRITPGERDTIEAIERNASKYGYNVGMRYIYAAKKGHFKGGNIAAMNRAFSAFDMIGRGTVGIHWRADFDYQWFADPFGKKRKAWKDQEIKELKRRSYIPKSLSDPMKIMSTEEIATLFHIPGRVALTPTLDRIPSTRSQAPSNLPIGDLPT